MTEKLMNARAALAAEWEKGASAMDFAKASAALKTISEEVDGLDRGYAAGKDMAAQVAQLRIDVDAASKAANEAARNGLIAGSGGRILVPGGRAARQEMLRDGRAFLDDEVARLFGAWYATTMLRARNFEVPKAISDMAEKAVKATPDVDPGTSSLGGALVPNLFRAELIRNVEAYGTLFTKARRVVIGLGTTTYPKRTAGQTAYWTSAGAKITQSGITFGTVVLQAEKLAALIAMPNEFMRDPTLLADMGNLAAVEIAYAIAYALDNAMANGDGTATYGGIIGIFQSATITQLIEAAATHTLLTTLAVGDIVAVAAGLAGSQYHGQAEWIGSLSVLYTILGLTTTAGAPLFMQQTDELSRRKILAGFPWGISQICPASTAIVAGSKYAAFGDLRQSHYCGMIRNVEIAVSTDVYFDQDMTAVRGVVHADIQEADPLALAIAKTADA